MSEEKKEEKKMRRVIYTGSFGPEVNLGQFGYCRVGEKPRDFEASIVDRLVVRGGPFRDATPEDGEPIDSEAENRHKFQRFDLEAQTGAIALAPEAEAPKQEQQTDAPPVTTDAPPATTEESQQQTAETSSADEASSGTRRKRTQ